MKPAFASFRHCIQAASIVAWLLGGLFVLGCGASYTVRLTASDIEQSVARKLPVSRSKLVATVTVRSVSVEFMLEEDKILLRPQIEVAVVGRTALTGRALVEGEIRYAPSSGEFFLDKPRVADVSVQGLHESVRPLVEDMVAKLGETYLATMPVYRLNPKDFKQSLAKLVLKSVKVRNGALELVLGT